MTKASSKAEKIIFLKRTIVIFLVLIAWYNQDFAQFKLGFVGGASIAYTTIRNTSTEEYKSTAHFGIGGILNVYKNFKLDIDLLYSIKGDNNRHIPLKLQYLSLPFIGSYSIFKKINLLFGPEFS